MGSPSNNPLRSNSAVGALASDKMYRVFFLSLSRHIGRLLYSVSWFVSGLLTVAKSGRLEKASSISRWPWYCNVFFSRHMVIVLHNGRRSHLVAYLFIRFPSLL